MLNILLQHCFEIWSYINHDHVIYIRRYPDYKSVSFGPNANHRQTLLPGLPDPTKCSSPKSFLLYKVYSILGHLKIFGPSLTTSPRSTWQPWRRACTITTRHGTRSRTTEPPASMPGSCTWTSRGCGTFLMDGPEPLWPCMTSSNQK